MKATEETKAKAKEAGIKSWHVKSEEKLQEELAGNCSVEFEKVPVVVEKPRSSPIEELFDLMNGMSLDQAMMKVKLRGKKSKFYPYKDIIEKKLNGN